MAKRQEVIQGTIGFDMSEFGGTFDPQSLSKNSSKKGSRKKSAPKSYDCNTCGLFKQCKSPKMKVHGRGLKKILIVALCPGAEEDKYGIPLIGNSGKLTDNTLSAIDIDINEDCWRTNVVLCRPPLRQGKYVTDPKEMQIKCCHHHLIETIERLKPKLIIAMGNDTTVG
jgi:uracil-DNA glycosylase family 4